MVYINLLPWREYKSKKLRVSFCVQLVVALCLPLLICSAIWFYQQQIIKTGVAEIKKIEIENQQLIAEIDDFETAKAAYQNQLPLIQNINRLLDKRFSIPGLLLFLQQQNLDFEVSHLSINQDAFKLKATDSSSNSAMSLLNNLRTESNFCQVRFTPKDSQDSAQLMEFELQAQFCDE